MKRLTIIFMLIVLLLIVTACGKTTEKPVAESVPVEAVAPQPTAAHQVMIPVAGGSADGGVDVVSPVATPVSPVGGLKTELTEGGAEGMDTEKLDAQAASVVEMVKKAMLGEFTSMSESDITVKNVAMQQWRNSSLGCPKEGMMYAQVITPGYLVEMEANGSVYEYHTDMGNTAILCAVDGQAVK